MKKMDRQQYNAIIVIIFITMFAIGMSCYALILYLTSRNYERYIIEIIFGMGFVCLWIMLGTMVLILIHQSETKHELKIAELEKELRDLKKS